MGRMRFSTMFHHIEPMLFRRRGNDATVRTLDALLDRQVTGTPAPVATDPGKMIDDSGADELALFLTDARTVLHRADARRQQQNDDDKQMIWENIMMQSNTAIARSHAPTSFKQWSGGSDRVDLPTHRRWNASLVNALVSAVLIVGLGFGIWQTWGMNDGGGGGDTPTQLAALLPSTATPAVLDRMVLPTATDCTVTPLTVDQVLAPINDPLSVWDDFEPGKKHTYAGSGAEDVSRDYVGPPNAVVFEQVSALQREWNACAIAGSWMQMFALMDPVEMKDVVETYVFPEYLSQDEGRVIIETLATTGKTPDGITAKGYFGGTLSFVHPDPAQSIQFLRGFVVPALVEYDTDGKYLRMDDLPLPGMGASFSYVWDEDQGRWIMYSVNGVKG